MGFDYKTEYQRYQQYYLNLNRFYQKPVARVSIFVVMSFMTVAFFSVFAIRPTLMTIAALIKEIEDKQKISTTLEKKIEDLSRIRADYSGWEAEKTAAKAALPDRPELARLILQVEVVAAQMEIKIVNWQIQPVTVVAKADQKNQKEEMIKFNLTAGGRFDRLKEFLDTVEKIDRLVVVKGMSLSSGTPFLKQAGITTTAIIRGEVYFMNTASGET